jgi:hypothetical protein
MKGKHDVDIVVIDNSYPDKSINSLKVFGDNIRVVPYTSDKIQSHGCALDFAVPLVETEYFIAAESDSFPATQNWLDLYAALIEQGFDAAGSVLQLSGGQYIHPAGAMYKKSVWEEAKEYCGNIQYLYYPNMAKKEGFDCHLMVHERAVSDFLNNPESFIDLADNYKPFSKQKAQQRLVYYQPVVGPFHNGMGNLQESIKTYGVRNISQDSPAAVLDNKEDLIYRIGYEPGQWLSYWMLATGKRIMAIPTETFWMPNRVNQQQERTINQCGFTHIWGMSSWKNCDKEDVQDIVVRKKQVENELYDSLPEKFKTPPEIDGGF